MVGNSWYMAVGNYNTPRAGEAGQVTQRRGDACRCRSGFSRELQPLVGAAQAAMG